MAITAKSLANLRPAKKGERSRNPGGTPQGPNARMLSAAVRELLTMPLKTDKKDRRIAVDRIAERLIETAIDPQGLRDAGEQLEAIRIIFDRTEGRPKQQIEHTGLDGGAILLSLQSQIERVYGSDSD